MFDQQGEGRGGGGEVPAQEVSGEREDSQHQPGGATSTLPGHAATLYPLFYGNSAVWQSDSFTQNHGVFAILAISRILTTNPANALLVALEIQTGDSEKLFSLGWVVEIFFIP